MFLMTICVKVPPNSRQNAIDTFKSMIGPTRVLPGCKCCYLYCDIDDDDRLLLIEKWESRETFEHHVRSQDFQYIFDVLELGQEPPELLIHGVTSTHGMQYIEESLQ